ncbi:MAG TPA: zinc ABC transporter substrate-binding protein [Dongiaceae bacterium]|nr:zinc ABC transporter substrate-binding protein [Dongiaceae bacterium]
MRRLGWLAGALAAFVLTSCPATAEGKPVAVATFSILADLTQRIAGDHVQVLTLVGPNGDAHVFEPGPKESTELAEAKLLIANGLGFEPWLARLEDASGFKGKMVVATDGVAALKGNEELGPTDPHAFQDLSNAQIYAANIAKGLAEADPAHAADFKVNADKLIADMGTLDKELKSEFAAVPQERRRILTSHDAFQYFGKAYGIEFVAVQGISTEAEPSAEDLATIVRQARDGHLSAIFLENMADPRLAETVAQESGVHMGGELYADALSEPNGPAPNYLSLVRYNAKQLLAAMQ